MLSIVTVKPIGVQAGVMGLQLHDFESGKASFFGNPYMFWTESCSQKWKKNNFVLFIKQEYILWNAVSVPLLQFARYCCRGHVTLAMPTFWKRCQGSRRDYPWNMPVKFEVRIFSRFGAISI